MWYLRRVVTYSQGESGVGVVVNNPGLVFFNQILIFWLDLGGKTTVGGITHPSPYSDSNKNKRKGTTDYYGCRRTTDSRPYTKSRKNWT